MLKQNIHRIAMRSALQLRRTLSIPRDSAINVFDVAQSIGVEVRFADIPSLEGMFYRGPDPKIILPSLAHRPKGRVSFSCAHELGHFQLGHGTRVDKYLIDPKNRSEYSEEEMGADVFASTLLMPRPAVLSRFAGRGWTTPTATPLQLYVIACELDVGYTTLIDHLKYGLDLVDNSWLTIQKKTTPKLIRELLTGRQGYKRVVVADKHWPDLPVDLEIGDCLAVLKTARVEPSTFLSNEDCNGEWRLFQATRVGFTRIKVDGIDIPIRIARQGYCGLLQYRFLEEDDT